jgi:3-hydroxyanthranilate 3,4-dioxygenase
VAREHLVFSFKEATKAGNYDERPMLPDDVDLQVHLSRNSQPQPFWLICEHDTVITTLSGEGAIEFKDAPVLRHSYETGDFVYVPAGTPTRILPKKRSVQYRYKAREAGLEGVAWYCEKCGRQLFRQVWDTAEKLSQIAYQEITEKFNASPNRRKCKSCGKKHPKVDTTGFSWKKLAKELAQSTTA